MLAGEPIERKPIHLDSPKGADPAVKKALQKPPGCTQRCLLSIYTSRHRLLTRERKSTAQLATMSTTLHQRPPFRAEHLGSLLRPEALLRVKHAIDEGDASLQEELSAVEDTAVKEIVKTQQGLGFRAVSDGEYRRHMFL